MINNLFRLFLYLGSEWVIWVLAACSIFAVAVFFDRWRALRKQERIGNILWRDFLGKWLSDGLPSDWKKNAIELSRSHPCVESRVLLALSRKEKTSPERLEALSQGLISAERLGLERYLAVLGTLGNSAPFIGLFGTVLGIIKAFAELDKATGNSGLATVSGGLAEALVTTAAGLLVALPSAIAYNFFQRKTRAIASRTASLASVVIGETADTEGH